MEKYTLVQNILLGLSLAAPIGPVNVEIIKRGLTSGFCQALFTGVGAMSADATYLALIFFGLASFLNISWLKFFLGIGGSIILVCLGAAGVKEFLRNTPITINLSRRLFKNPYTAGYMLAFFSPMTIVWWTGVFGAMLAAQPNTVNKLNTFLSCLSILLGCFIWVSLISATLHWGKRIINDRFLRFVSLIAGVFLVGFGIYFLQQTVRLLSL